MAKAAGIQVFVVVAGKTEAKILGQWYMDDVATDPQETHILALDTFDDLSDNAIARTAVFLPFLEFGA